MTHWLITLTKSQIHGLRKENAPYYKPPPTLHIICLPFSFFYEIIVKMFCVNHNNFCHFFTKRLMLFAFKEKEEAEEYLNCKNTCLVINLPLF
ncbi:hypothetical protein T03_15357, partial [Trichinella britovi]